MDFGNGLQYDPTTGRVIINDESGKPIYQYDPTAPGGGKTTYNGQSYTGRYNPLALGAITEDQVSGAYDKYLPSVQQSQMDYYKSHGLDTTGAGDKSQPILDQLAFNKAASEATKKLSPQDQDFFNTLKTMAAQKQTVTSTPTVKSPQSITQPTPQLLPTIEPPKPQQGTVSTQPFYQPTETKGPEAPAQQPDYAGFLQAVYAQAQPYLAQMTAASQTPKPTNLSNTTSPSFSLGGYNPQQSTKSQGPTISSSGKGTPNTEPSEVPGMATGQFGSK